MLFLTRPKRLYRPYTDFGIVGDSILIQLSPEIKNQNMAGYLDTFPNLDLKAWGNGKLEIVEAYGSPHGFIIFEPLTHNELAKLPPPRYSTALAHPLFFRRCRLQYFAGGSGQYPAPRLIASDEVSGYLNHALTTRYLNYAVLLAKKGDYFRLVYDQSDQPGDHITHLFKFTGTRLKKIDITVSSYAVYCQCGSDLPLTIGELDEWGQVALKNSEWCDLRPKSTE